jgi:hypothetical protein
MHTAEYASLNLSQRKQISQLLIEAGADTTIKSVPEEKTARQLTKEKSLKNLLATSHDKKSCIIL